MDGNDGMVAADSIEVFAGGVAALVHGGVVIADAADPAAGRDIGAFDVVAKFALEDARARKLTVVAQCPFVANYIQKHPEYQDLLK